MNGNGRSLSQSLPTHKGLASNSWSVWMETTDVGTAWRNVHILASNSWSVWMETCSAAAIGELLNTCFQFVKRMNGNYQDCHCHRRPFYLASNSWSVWMETTNFVKPDNSPFLAVNLLPIREAYEWKRLALPGQPPFQIESCFQFVKRMNGNSGVSE